MFAVGCFASAFGCAQRTVNAEPNRIFAGAYALQTFEHGAVFKRYHDDRAPAGFGAHTRHAVIKRHFESRDFYGLKAAYVDKRADRVGAIEKHRHVVAPMRGVAVGYAVPSGFAVVQIFALAVFERAQRAAAV